MKKQCALDVQGRALERKQEASLKEIDTQNRPHRVVLQPHHKLIFLHLLLPSHRQHQQKSRIQPEIEMNSEPFEEIPEISSGYVIFDINIFINLITEI